MKIRKEFMSFFDEATDQYARTGINELEGF